MGERRDWMRLRLGLASILAATIFAFPFSSAPAETWKIPQACKIVAFVLKEGRDPLSKGEPSIKPIKVKEVSVADLKSILPEKDLEELKNFPYIAITRFDYDGDGVNDLVMRLGDGGTAQCEYWQVYKGVAKSKRVVHRISPPEEDDGTQDAFCRQENAFARIGNHVYRLTAAPSYPYDPDGGYRVFDPSRQIDLCKITSNWNWKTAPITGDCEDETVCAAVKAQARKLMDGSASMLAGKQMPRIECDSDDGAWGKDWFGGWKIDMDNDGTEEFYARQTENYGGYSEYYLDAQTPNWSECGKDFLPTAFSPQERWRFEPDKLEGIFRYGSEKNFIRVSRKNYWLLIRRDLKTEIRIVLIERGIARQVGTVTVGPPKISVKIERY